MFLTEKNYYMNFSNFLTDNLTIDIGHYSYKREFFAFKIVSPSLCINTVWFTRSNLRRLQDAIRRIHDSYIDQSCKKLIRFYSLKEKTQGTLIYAYTTINMKYLDKTVTLKQWRLVSHFRLIWRCSRTKYFEIIESGA